METAPWMQVRSPKSDHGLSKPSSLTNTILLGKQSLFDTLHKETVVREPMPSLPPSLKDLEVGQPFVLTCSRWLAPSATKWRGRGRLLVGAKHVPVRAFQLTCGGMAAIVILAALRRAASTRALC